MLCTLLLYRPDVSVSIYAMYFGAITVTRHTLHATLDLDLPDSSDVQGSIEGLIRLQETYQLTTDQLAHGVIHDVISDQPMGGQEMYAMGKAAMRAGYFGLAVQWFEKAISCREDLGVNTADAIADLANAYQLVSPTTIHLLTFQLYLNQFTIDLSESSR